MEYSTRQEGEFVVVSLAREVDLHYSPQARKCILDNLNKEAHVLVDLSQVKYIDSSGIASLVEGFQLARSKKLQFGNLPGLLQLPGRQPGNVGLQIIGYIVEDFLIRIAAAIPTLRVGSDTRLCLIRLVEPVPTRGVIDRDIQRDEFAIRSLDCAANNNVSKCVS